MTSTELQKLADSLHALRNKAKAKGIEYALRHESAGRMARYKAARRNALLAAWLFLCGVLIAIGIIAYYLQ